MTSAPARPDTTPRREKPRRCWESHRLAGALAVSGGGEATYAEMERAWWI